MDIPGLANLGAVAVIAVFAVREFFAYLSKKSNGNGKPSPPSSGSDSIANAAGLKSSDWWELTFARIVKQCLDDHQARIARPLNEEAAQMRQEILDAIKQLERRVSEAVAEMHRQNRDR